MLGMTNMQVTYKLDTTYWRLGLRTWKNVIWTSYNVKLVITHECVPEQVPWACFVITFCIQMTCVVSKRCDRPLMSPATCDHKCQRLSLAEFGGSKRGPMKSLVAIWYLITNVWGHMRNRKMNAKKSSLYCSFCASFSSWLQHLFYSCRPKTVQEPWPN